MIQQKQAIRGPILTYTDNHSSIESSRPFHYFADAIIMLLDGVITDVEPAQQVLSRLPSDTNITRSDRCRIIREQIHQ